MASAALLGLFFIPSVFGEVVNQLFRTRYGSIISINANIRNVTAGLFGSFERITAIVTDFDGEVASASEFDGAASLDFLVCAVPDLCVLSGAAFVEGESLRSRQVNFEFRISNFGFAGMKGQWL